MSTEEQLIESLKQTIKVQDDLILHLKSRIDDLKASQTVLSPYSAPNLPIGTQPLPINPSPFISPLQAGTGTPWLNSPFIVTSGTMEAKNPPGLTVTNTSHHGILSELNRGAH